MKSDFGMRLRKAALLIAAALGLGGCGRYNAVDLVGERDWFSPGKGRAAVVVGVGYDTEEPPSNKFSAALEQVIEQGTARSRFTGETVKSTVTTGWCTPFYLKESLIVAKANRQVAITRYVFDVPAGHYAYRGVLRPPFGKEAAPDVLLAFYAPAGATVYFGDFVYRGQRKSSAGLMVTNDVELRRDLTGVREFLKSYRAIKDDPKLAETEMVGQPTNVVFCAL